MALLNGIQHIPPYKNISTIQLNIGRQEGKIYTPNTHIHDLALSWLGTGTSNMAYGAMNIEYPRYSTLLQDLAEMFLKSGVKHNDVISSCLVIVSLFLEFMEVYNNELKSPRNRNTNCVLINKTILVHLPNKHVQPYSYFIIIKLSLIKYTT